LGYVIKRKNVDNFCGLLGFHLDNDTDPKQPHDETPIKLAVYTSQCNKHHSASLNDAFVDNYMIRKRLLHDLVWNNVHAKLLHHSL
jgi:hypothetical protein